MNAIQAILAKAPMPTSLSSAEIRDQIARDILKRSVFSARTTEYGYVSRIKDVLARVASGEINRAKARELLLGKLQELGYDPLRGFKDDAALGIPPAEAGSLRDLSSVARLKLVVETNQRQAYSEAQKARGSDPAALDLFPGWRLARVYPRRVSRSDWPDRWQAACDAAGGEGAAKAEMVARKDSPVWQALGDGAGGFKDTLGTDTPPFAYGSGHMWLPESRASCVALGIMDAGDEVAAPDLSMSPGESEIATALQRLGAGFAEALRAELKGAA